MVSTATKVGNFTFDNCLMNAAGDLLHDQRRAGRG